MKRHFVWMLPFLAACSTTSTTENSDSTSIAEDTLVLEADYMEEAAIVLDTIITETLDLKSAFTSPQFKPTIAYVYSEEGLSVIEKNMNPFAAEALVIGEIQFRSAVTLVEPLVNNLESDTLMISGLKGRMVAVDYQGKPGFVFSGFLLNLPVPEEGISTVEYFTQNLHMVKPAVNVRHECKNCDGLSDERTYEFEQGITVTDNSYYESYDKSVYFQGSITLQEVFLFARHFFPKLRQDFLEFPTAPVQKDLEEGASMEASWQNGRVVKIIAVTGQGCYEEEGVQIEHGRIKMSANGGC